MEQEICANETWSFEYCPNDGLKFRHGEGRCRLCNICRHQTVVPRNDTDVKARRTVPHEADWEKILYVKRKVDDNHVGAEFFSYKETENEDTTDEPPFSSLVVSSVYISLHLAFLVVFLAVWQLLRNNKIGTHTVFALDIFLLVVCATYSNTQAAPKFQTVLYWKQDQVNFVSRPVFLLLLWIISPLLKDLTSSYSDDTVWTLCSLFFLLHLFLMDFDGKLKPRLEKGAEFLGHGLSVNSAIASCVLLVSRFSPVATSYEVFATILLGILVFAFSPGVVREVRETSYTKFALLCIAVYSSALVAAYSFSFLLLKIVVGVISGVVLLGPLGLSRARKQVLVITGPWDLPKIRVYGE